MPLVAEPGSLMPPTGESRCGSRTSRRDFPTRARGRKRVSSRAGGARRREAIGGRVERRDLASRPGSADRIPARTFPRAPASAGGRARPRSADRARPPVVPAELGDLLPRHKRARTVSPPRITCRRRLRYIGSQAFSFSLAAPLENSSAMLRPEDALHGLPALAGSWSPGDARSAALSRSASSMTMIGSLPPSSSTMRL